MSIDLIARAGGVNYRLTDWMQCAVSEVLNDVGAMSLSYPASSPHASVLISDADVIVTVALDGLPAPVGFVLDDDGFEEAVDDQGQVVYSLTGRSLESLLERAIVYPPVLGTLPVETPYASATPGAIFADQLTKAHARGGLTGLTGSYTGSVDSAGVAWAFTFTGSVDPGTDLLALARDFAARGLLDFRVRITGPGAYALDLFNAASPSGLGRVTTNAIRPGGDGTVTGSPRKRTKRDIGTDMLVLGDNGVVTTVGDSTARTKYERREKFQSQSGISDSGTLAALGTLGLSQVSHPKQGRTLSLSPAAGLVVLTTLRLGDYFPYNPGNGWVTERVTSINYAISSDEARTCELGLSDRFDDLDVANARKLDRITRGGVASSSASPPVTFVTDSLAPSAPASVSLSTATYLNSSGNTEAQITISWAAVTSNVDSSPIGDLAGYEIQDRIGSAAWKPLGRVDSGVTVAFDSGFQPGQSLTARVRAYDTSGNVSSWATSSAITAASDTTPPPAPSTPTIDATQFLGTLRVRWDGLDYVGNPMPGDFARLEVHASTSNGFTPTAATLTDEFVTPTGGVTAIAASTSTPTYIKFIAVDRSGNRSSASSQASGTGVQVVNADLVTGIVNARLLAAGAVEQAAIANLAVGTAQMIDATIVNAKIASLAVDDAKIASVSVGKLTVGTLSADVTVSARIKTANSGARVEMNSVGVQAFAGAGTYPQALMSSAGFYHYNSGGVEDFGADSSGVRMSGTFTSGKSPDPRVEIYAYTGFGGYSSNVQLYSGTPGESLPGEVSVGTGYIRLSSPQSGGSSGTASIYLTASNSGGVGGLIQLQTPNSNSEVTIDGWYAARAQAKANTLIECGSFDVSVSAANAAAGTQFFTTAFTTAPHVTLTCKGTGDCVATLTNTPGTGSFGWRFITRAATNITATITVHYVAIGG